MTVTLAPAPAADLFTDHVCIVVTCVGCGQEFEDADTEWTVHFRSIPEAAAALARREWTVTDGGPLCWHCTEDAKLNGGDVTALEVLQICAYCWPPLYPDMPAPAQCQCHDAPVAHIVRAPYISLLQRGFTPVTCVSFQCSDCARPFEDYESEAHLDSLQEALHRGRENQWTISASVIRCYRCRLRRICATRGHLLPAGSRSCQRCFELPGDPAVIL